VARVCQVTSTTVARWIDQGLLKGHKTPTGRRRVEADDLAEFLAAHGMSVPPELRTTQERPVVVVVEDDATYRRALVKTLERSKLGIEVVEAATGMDGLLEIGRAQPAVILLDYLLPDLNAVQVVERLQERRGGAEIIIVTAALPEQAEEKLQQAGVRTVVNKIDGMLVVVDAIRQALQRRKVA
jgi:CheY-like chemotaxis protein